MNKHNKLIEILNNTFHFILITSKLIKLKLLLF